MGASLPLGWRIGSNVTTLQSRERRKTQHIGSRMKHMSELTLLFSTSAVGPARRKPLFDLLNCLVRKSDNLRWHAAVTHGFGIALSFANTPFHKVFDCRTFLRVRVISIEKDPTVSHQWVRIRARRVGEKHAEIFGHISLGVG